MGERTNVAKGIQAGQKMMVELRRIDRRKEREKMRERIPTKKRILRHVCVYKLMLLTVKFSRTSL